MPANPNWARWSFASMAAYLKEVATDAQLPSLIEGFDIRNEAFENAGDRAEIRVTGPFTWERSHGFYQLDLLANVLLTSYFNGPQKNAYSIHTNLGLFHEAMDMVIPVFKLGSEQGDDDEVQIGCLYPVGTVSVYHFGQINKTEQAKQGLVDARYRMELSD